MRPTGVRRRRERHRHRLARQHPVQREFRTPSAAHAATTAAEIVEQIPDQRIAWRSTSGAMTAGVVKFQPLSDAQSKVYLELEYDPQGCVENVGDAVGVVSQRVEGDLQRFKQYIEGRGSETGAWRGKIQ